MRYIVEASAVNKFKYCPYCGEEWVSVYDGDFMGQTECLNCDDELEFIILEEYRDRYPDSFKKMIYRKEIGLPKLFSVTYMDDCEFGTYLTVGESIKEVEERESIKLEEELSCFMGCTAYEVSEVEGYKVKLD